MDDLKTKLLQKIKGDVLAADLVWSLFKSALDSYRHDSVLRPFPGDYMQGELEKDFTALVRHLKMLVLFAVS